MSAEAQAAIARKAMEDSQVRAPFAGMVAKRWVNQGDKVAVDMPVAQVVDLARMEIEAQIPAGEIPFVKVGQPISVQIDGFAARRFTGRIERVSPAAEAGSRSIAVYASLPNADRALKGGMFANGTVATGTGVGRTAVMTRVGSGGATVGASARPTVDAAATVGAGGEVGRGPLGTVGCRVVAGVGCGAPTVLVAGADPPAGKNGGTGVGRLAASGGRYAERARVLPVVLK